MKRRPAQSSRSSRQAKPVVFGVGLIALDLVISADADTPIRAWAGGTCGNVLAILSYLGWDAYPVARLNAAPASLKVKADLARWGTHPDFLQCEPANDTPIIVQEIRRSVNGQPTHRFRWACPHCGHWLPRYRAVTLRGATSVRPHLSGARLFFMDRLSPAALDLAREAAARGAVVVFEPSSRTDDRLLDIALGIAHIVKYADHRVALRASTRPGPSVLLQIETMGPRGLRYRSWLPQAKTQRWEHLDSVKAPFVADTCGAGDWCSAGILASLATEGQEGLTKRSASQLELALRYGQTLAAWNCGFEGARGGMYAVDRVSFEKQVRRIGRGAEATTFRHATASQESSTVVPCPACRAAS